MTTASANEKPLTARPAGSAWLRPSERALAPPAAPRPAAPAKVRWVGRFAGHRHPADLYSDIAAGRTDVIVVDARWAEGYSAEHIPGAINLFCRSIDAVTTAALRRDAEYVVYCWNESCHASTLAAERLEELGFRACELHGGLQRWKSEGYPTERG